MTKEVKLPTGAVMKVYTPDGKQIKDLDGFEDEGKYIATGAEKLNKELCRELHSGADHWQYLLHCSSPRKLNLRIKNQKKRRKKVITSAEFVSQS